MPPLLVLGARDHQIVDVDAHKQGIASVAPPVDGRLVWALLEAYSLHGGIQLGIPSSRCLPQAVEGLAQAQHLVLLARDDKSRRLVDLDLLLHVAVEKRRLDVHVVDAALLGSQRKEETHRLHPCNTSEGIVKIDPLLLHEPACHQASLVLDNSTNFILLQLVHPQKVIAR